MEIRDAEKRPLERAMFGESIYWLCMIAVVVLIVGMVIAIANVDANVLNPHFLFAYVWEGEGVEAVWYIAGEREAGGHLWLDYFFTGDGISQLGLVMGLMGPAIGAFLVGVIYLLKRSYGWALGAFWIAALIIFAAFF